MHMDVVSIIDDVHDCNLSNSSYTIYWNSGKSGKNIASINEYVQNNSIPIREKYLAFVNQFHESSYLGRRILDYLDVGKGYNLWWMSTLFEKSPFKTPGIYNCQKLLALELILSKLSFKSVHLYSNDELLIESIEMLCETLEVSFKCIQSTDRLHSKKEYYERIMEIINRAKRTNKILFSILAQAFSPSRYKKTGNGNSLFVLSYLLNIDLNKLNEGRFYSNYWGGIQNIFDGKNLNMNWVHTYLNSNLIKSFGEAASLVKEINRSSPLNVQHSILQSNLSFSGIVKCFIVYIKLRLSIPNNNKIKKLFYLSNSNIWFWPYLKKDWNNSVYGSTAIFNLLMIFIFDSLLSKIPHQKNGLYLIENQGWERAFIHAWRRYNHGYLIGVHHTVMRFWDTRFFDVNVDTELIMKLLPQPDLIAVTGPHMKELYDQTGYSHEKIVEVEALRYMHLNNLKSKRKSAKYKDTKNKNSFLILGSGNYKETQNILNVVSQNKILFDSFVSFIPHPSSVNRYYFDKDVIKEERRGNFDIAINFSVAIMPPSTAASVDMFIIGLKVIIYNENSDFHLCPLLGIKPIYYASSSEEFSAIVQSDHTEIPGKRFFWDDVSLPRWKRLLKKLGYDQEI